MRTSNGFDRISTPEELHQVLAVLDEFARSAWASVGDNQLDSTPWIEEAPLDDADAESLAELVMNRPGLRN
jgi:hypothetical protein